MQTEAGSNTSSLKPEITKHDVKKMLKEFRIKQLQLIHLKTLQHKKLDEKLKSQLEHKLRERLQVTVHSSLIFY